MDEQRLLSVRDLKTHFAGEEGTTRAVDGVSFDLSSGRTLGVVGETGCGKSVTARSILRIVDKPGRIVGGEILLRKGDDWLDLAKLSSDSPQMRAVRGGDIGLVFQEPMAAFSPVHTVGNQLMEAVRLHCEIPKQEIRSQAVHLLERVGVPRPQERLAAYPWQLSGGLLQRCMIAMAMAGKPRILIADEPTTALDVITQAHILDLIREIQERTKLSIMLITHDLSVVAQMADEVAVMYLGRVVEHGPVDEIFEAPKHPYTRALLQSIPSRHQTARVRLPTIAGSIPNPFNRPAGCTFHPRCAQLITGVCDRSEPASHAQSDGHRVACHAYDDAGLPLLTISEAAPISTNGQAADHRGPAQPEPALLQVNHLSKGFAMQGKRLGRSKGKIAAVDDVTFELRAAETLALVGESGSGKTTTSRCILRAVAPDSGEILFRTKAGKVVNLGTLPAKRLRPLRPEIQMIFQDPYSSLNPRMTILDLIGEPLLVNGVRSRQERSDRVAELLSLVGLRPEYMRRFPHAFSGGQRQRIGIARALALNPRLIVADEPVSALDVSVQAQTLNLLMELQDRLHLTYLFVSHDLSVVRHISDRVGVMFDGQLVELGETRAILDEPKHPYTAALLAAIPKPDPRARAMFNIPRATGEPGALTGGCRFRRRCPFAAEVCETEKPIWQEVEPGRHVRCHRVQELQLSPVVTSGAGRA